MKSARSKANSVLWISVAACLLSVVVAILWFATQPPSERIVKNDSPRPVKSAGQNAPSEVRAETPVESSAPRIPLAKVPSLGKRSKSTELASPSAGLAVTPAKVATASLGKTAHLFIPAPPLERERIANEPKAQGEVIISSGFECSAPLSVVRKSSTHYAVKFEGKRGSLDNYFLFQIKGVKGKTIRIDFEEAPLNKWWSLNPVYSYVSDLSDPANFRSEPVANPKPPVKAHNGPLLPDTSGEKWHFMPNVWTELTGLLGQPGEIKTRTGRLCMVQTFDEDSAFVALKVPYTPSMNERFMESLKGNPHAKVIEIAKTPEGRPMQIVKIGGDDEADKTRPCVLMYAREHGTEQDSSWVVEGTLRYLISDDDEAKALRKHFTFLLLPVMDSDGAALSYYDRIECGFMTTTKMPETIANANWFQRCVNKGMRLDLVLNLHNVESSEIEHVSCALAEQIGERGSASDKFNKLLSTQLLGEQYFADLRPWKRGWSPARLGGWLSRRYGALTVAFEVNSQAPSVHLSLSQTRRIGALMANCAAELMTSEPGRELLSDVTNKRAERADRWKNRGDEASLDLSAIDAEAVISQGIGIVTYSSSELRPIETWIP